MASDSNQDLLLGFIALQMGFVRREQLVAAVRVWLSDKSRPVEEILVEQGAMSEADRRFLAPLVARHLENHNGNVTECLTALSSIGSVADELWSLGDDQVKATLTTIASRSPAVVGEETHAHTPATTQPSGVGSQSSTGSRFRILRPHARGGLGEVSVAEDTELNREVALKEIQMQFADDPASQQRFMVEAEVTGGLEHPGIVPVYGLGRYGDGRPFYAMRFIRGDSLQDAVDRFYGKASEATKLSHDAETSQIQATEPDFDSIEFRKLLGRFVDVCQAIEYAHSRGVLHRDLKPGNIMLGKYGETLVVDWGLAKTQKPDESTAVDFETALRPSAASDSAPTVMGRAIGTPAFMPPEQAAGRLDELGSASDVYSLGATLYTLLTGQAPFSGSNVGEILGKVKAGDFASPRHVWHQVPKALEAVCLKAMSLHSADRYSSPQQIADEVERFLADESVSALRESVLGKARRWLRKHPRTVAALTATLLVGLSSAIVVSTVVVGKNTELAKANRAERQARQQAEKNAELVAQANAKILASERQVRQERDIAVAINDFVQHDLLGQASPNEEPDRDIKLRTVLDRASAAIGNRFQDQPLVEAAIAGTIGNAYRSLGEYTQADPNLERALNLHQNLLGEEAEATLVDRSNLALLREKQGRLEDAELMLLDALATMEQQLGEDHPETMTAANNLALVYAAQGRFEAAESLLSSVLEDRQRVLGEQHEHTIISINNLGQIYAQTGRFEDAESHFEQVLELSRDPFGTEHPYCLVVMNNLANTYAEQGRWEDAEAMFEEALEIQRRVITEEHADTLKTMNNLANLHFKQGRFDEALTLNEKTFEIRKRVLGPEHPETLSSQNNLALVHSTLKRYPEAEALFDECVKTLTRVLGSEHPSTVQCMSNLAQVYMFQQRYGEAETLFNRVLEAQHSSLGPEHPSRLLSLNSLANLYQAQGRLDEARKAHSQILKTRRRVLGEKHPDTLGSMNNLAFALHALGEYEEAISLFEELLPTIKAGLGLAHPNTMTVLDNLSYGYEATGQHGKAETLRRDLVTAAKQRSGDKHPQTALTLVLLGMNLLQQKKYAQAEEVLRESLEIRQQTLPGHWSVFNTQVLLGKAIAGQKRHEEAEPFLLEGCEGLIEGKQSIPPPVREQRIQDAKQGIIELYEAWGKTEKAADWRARAGNSEATAKEPKEKEPANGTKDENDDSDGP